jgi:hypothetical protein
MAILQQGRNFKVHSRHFQNAGAFIRPPAVQSARSLAVKAATKEQQVPTPVDPNQGTVRRFPFNPYPAHLLETPHPRVESFIGVI